MSELLKGLYADHANFAKVLNVIESQAEAISAGETPHLDAVVKAVTYLGGYPALFHHPAEDAICQCLKKARPALSGTVDSIMAEHTEVAVRLAALRRTVESALAGSAALGADFAEAAFAFADAEWKHMEKEGTLLFPAAQAVLSAKDWRLLQERTTLDSDLHLRSDVPKEIERLHDLMVECRSFDDRRIQRRALEAAQSTK